MPEPSRTPRTYVPWTLSKAHDTGQLVCVSCGLCPGKRYYRPADLKVVFGDMDAHSLAPFMKCERCGKKDYMRAELVTPIGEEAVRIKVRRLVRIKTKRVPVWRDD
jgi:predicted metal-binding protein